MRFEYKEIPLPELSIGALNDIGATGWEYVSHDRRCTDGMAQHCTTIVLVKRKNIDMALSELISRAQIAIDTPLNEDQLRQELRFIAADLKNMVNA